MLVLFNIRASIICVYKMSHLIIESSLYESNLYELNPNLFTRAKLRLRSLDTPTNINRKHFQIFLWSSINSHEVYAIYICVCTRSVALIPESYVHMRVTFRAYTCPLHVILSHTNCKFYFVTKICNPLWTCTCMSKTFIIGLCEKDFLRSHFHFHLPRMM